MSVYTIAGTSLDAYRAVCLANSYNFNVELEKEKEPIVEESEETRNETDSESGTSFSDSPAAELILSNQMHRQLRSLTFNARNYMLSPLSKDSSSSSKVSKMIEKCSTLGQRLNGEISNGQRTYIQAEIDKIKREVSTLDIAL